MTPSPGQRRHTSPSGARGRGRGGPRPRGQSRQHGQPLRGGGGRLSGQGVPQQKGTWHHPARLWAVAPVWGGGSRGSSAPPAPSRTSRREAFPCRACPRDAPLERQVPGRGETTSPRNRFAIPPFAKPEDRGPPSPGVSLLGGCGPARQASARLRKAPRCCRGGGSAACPNPQPSQDCCPIREELTPKGNPKAKKG